MSFRATWRTESSSLAAAVPATGLAATLSAQARADSSATEQRRRGVLIDDGCRRQRDRRRDRGRPECDFRQRHNGIAIEGQGTTGNVVRGNFIGTSGERCRPSALPESGAMAFDRILRVQQRDRRHRRRGRETPFPVTGSAESLITGPSTIGNRSRATSSAPTQTGDRRARQLAAAASSSTSRR